MYNYFRFIYNTTNTPRAFTNATNSYQLLSFSPLAFIIIPRSRAGFAFASSFKLRDESSALIHSTASIWYLSNRYCLCIESIIAN